MPDLWQQQAVTALREGKDVVVQAPTGSGKTLIFELWSNTGKPKGQAIYTVPTRALANDKLAEWRARGWNVGIATGEVVAVASGDVEKIGWSMEVVGRLVGAIVAFIIVAFLLLKTSILLGCIALYAAVELIRRVAVVLVISCLIVVTAWLVWTWRRKPPSTW